MTVEIRGLSELLDQLEQRFGPQSMISIIDDALVAASGVYKTALLTELNSFKDTGATVDELTFSEPYDVDGVRTITVHWKGPKGRYRVIHLNEYGTVKNPNPRGKGAIQRSLQAAKTAYQQEIARVLGRSM
jgi:hypothetical protein